jgi:hypothetical protein
LGAGGVGEEGGEPCFGFAAAGDVYEAADDEQKRLLALPGDAVIEEMEMILNWTDRIHDQVTELVNTDPTLFTPSGK